MQKKILISFGILALIGIMGQAYANSTIYTDELGRLHFLGKDPGAKTLQKIEDYDNPKQQDLTNVMYKNEQPVSNGLNETTTVEGQETPVSDKTKVHTNKSKGSYTFNKGAMDASDPYTFGNTNVDTPKKDGTELEDLSKKRFWQIW